MTTIPTEVLDVLRSVRFEGGLAKMEGQLERSLYLKVNKVLEALGGQWSRKQRGHVFDGDGEAFVRDAIHFGEYTDPKKEMQFFETPDWLADELVAPLNLQSDTRILEPSAGRGAIIRACNRAGAISVHAVEKDAKHCGALGELANSLLVTDFLALKPTSLFFDAVAMNPPFTRGQDMAHVRHAWDFLAPGGQLAAITSIGWTFRNDRKPLEFRDWLGTIGATVVENPADAFRESGTLCRTVRIYATKEHAQ